MTAVRLGYTCHDALPATTTNTQQIVWTLTEIARLGASVDLYVPALQGAGDPRAAIARHYGLGAEGLPDRLRVAALGARGPRGGLARGWFDVRAPFRVRTAHDLIWTRDPVALAAALRTGVPVLFETYRPDFAAARAFAPWRALCLRHPGLLGIVTHSSLAARAFVDAGVDAARVLVAHNGYAPSLMQPPLTPAAARATLGIPIDGPLVVYTGHVGPEKGTASLVDLAAALPQVRVGIVGVEAGTPEQVWLERLAAARGVRNLLLVPRVGVADVAPYLYAADCLLIPPTGEPLTRYGRTVLPMKLFPYMAARRPILAPALPDIQELLTDDSTAVLTPPGDVPAAARALRALLDDAARAARLAGAAADAARDLTWHARATRILAFVTGRLGAAEVR